jgi:ribonuclease HI
MATFNPYAMYVNCDGAMDYDSRNHGGVGFVIKFPESLQLEDISHSIGRYVGANIERMEIEALIQAMTEVTKLFNENENLVGHIPSIIFVTDRFGLREEQKTNAYAIRQWRSNNWKNHEGKPIKNHELLNKLDKLRKKLSQTSRARINIEYRSRKQNKAADKLAKAGKKDGLIISTLLRKSEKIGRRKFDGPEIKYKQLSDGQEIHVNIFKKEPVQDQWEVWAELCEGEYQGQKMKFYVDDVLAGKLNRGNQYVLRVKQTYRFHLDIFRMVKKLS